MSNHASKNDNTIILDNFKFNYHSDNPVGSNKVYDDKPIGYDKSSINYIQYYDTSSNINIDDVFIISYINNTCEDDEVFIW